VGWRRRGSPLTTAPAGQAGRWRPQVVYNNEGVALGWANRAPSGQRAPRCPCCYCRTTRPFYQNAQSARVAYGHGRNRPVGIHLGAPAAKSGRTPRPPTTSYRAQAPRTL